MATSLRLRIRGRKALCGFCPPFLASPIITVTSPQPSLVSVLGGFGGGGQDTYSAQCFYCSTGETLCILRGCVRQRSPRAVLLKLERANKLLGSLVKCRN